VLGERASALFVPVALAACGHPAAKPQRPDPGPAPKVVTLAVLPAESNDFPNAAKAITDALAHAHISGVDRTQVSKVSLEVVQLSIECVEPSPACYQLVARSLSADRILFAQIAPVPKSKELKVTVSLFAMTDLFPHTAERVFTSEQEASDKVGELLTEVAQ
jgi:hypothetical protein